MTQKTDSIEITRLREMAVKTIAAESASPEVADSARDLLDTMRQEAAEHGFSDADVIKAILRPIFKKTRGCSCYSCKARRAEVEDDTDSQPMSIGGSW